MRYEGQQGEDELINGLRGVTGKSVLVVEDDPSQALELISVLNDCGATVLGPIADLIEAITLIEEMECHGAILDLRVGNDNSTTVAARLLEAGIPFVIFSGYPDSARLISKKDGWTFIQKPAPASEVVGPLSELVDAKARISLGTSTPT